MITLDAAAKALGKARKTLGRWRKAGAPFKAGPGGTAMVDLAALRAWLEARGRTGKPGRPLGRSNDEEPVGAPPPPPQEPAATGRDADPMRMAEVRRRNAVAALAELRLERARGELISRVDHEAKVALAITTVRTVMLATPRKYGAHFVGLEDEGVARFRLDEVMKELLDLFAGRLNEREARGE